MIRTFAAPFLVGALAAGATAQTLMVVESTNEAVMLFDGFDGSLINPTFIDLTTAIPAPSTPIEALVVGSEIWITDQVADSLFRYTLDGTTFLGAVTGGLDNIRGFEVTGGDVNVSNSGTGGGAPDDAIVVFDTTGAPVTNWPAGDPFDVLNFGGDLLIANIADENLDVHATDGTFLFTFHDSDGVSGIDFPEQLSNGVGGNILAAGFSTPSGIYEYDPTGAQVNYYDTSAIGGQGGLRGVWQLGNGNILFTNASGVHVLDPTVPAVTTVVTGVSGRFVSEAPGTQTNTFCFGDGSGTGCPCGNPGGAGEGCANSSGAGGVLGSSGSSSVGADDLTFLADNLLFAQPALLFSGEDALNGGNGIVFGDGLRCAGTNVIRLGTMTPDMNGAASWGPGLAALAGYMAGDTRYFQGWYRDPMGSPCGNGFNLTNGVQIDFLP